MGVRLELITVWGAAAGTWIPMGMWGPSLSDAGLLWPFISSLIMLGVVTMPGALRPVIHK